MKNIHSIITLLCLFTLSSCEDMIQTVDMDELPPFEEKLIVTSFISPQQSEVTVHVEKNRAIWGSQEYYDNNYVTDAIVKLSLKGDESNVITLPYSENGDYMISNDLFSILEGESYTLSVEALGKTTTASCSIPYQNTSLSISSEVLLGNNKQKIKGTWKDREGEENYYRIKLEEVYNNSSSDSYPLTLNKEYFSDVNRDGDDLIFIHEEETFSSPIETVNATFLSVDYHYYKYHETLETAEYSKDDPFSEVINVYSNMEGDGIGIFAGFNIYRTTVNLFDISIGEDQ